jgi:FemAB-related protein (PEP-CTERM system-associated)
MRFMSIESGHPGVGVRVSQETDGFAWDRFVDAHPGARQYHRWVWKRVVERSFGHRTLYLSARRGGEIAGVLPLVVMKSALFGRFLVSLPFFNYGGVLAVGGDSEVEAALFAAAAAAGAAERASFVELRHEREHVGLAATRSHKVAMVLPLPPTVEALWKSFDTRNRNHIRKAQNAGLTFGIDEPGGLAAFYDVFSRNMRDLGTPVYGRNFFETIVEELGAAATVVVVRMEGKPVAAGILLHHRDTVEIPWASSLRRYNPLCPNYLLYWQALTHAIAIGRTTFDFGRSTVGAGTYKFKGQWGAKPCALHWQYWLAPGAQVPDLNPDGGRFQLAVRLWRQLPVGLTRVIGPPIVRYIP